MNHHGMFFATDHHWKPETGLWAARHILRFLRDDYGWPVEPENLSPEKFDYAVSHGCFLGALGKKITLSRARPDDFTVIYPKRNIMLDFSLPDMGLNISGDFSVFYGMKYFVSGDYYGNDTYMTYCYGTRPMLKARRTDGGRKKLFLIRNSFSSVIIPFLSLEIGDISAVDLRYLRGMADGSIRRYIAEERPDAVILIYHVSVPGRTSEIDRRLWDFH